MADARKPAKKTPAKAAPPVNAKQLIEEEKARHIQTINNFRSIPTWILVLAAALAAILVIGTVFISVKAVSTSSAVEAAKQSTKRSDCARRIGNEQQLVDRGLQIAKSSHDLAVGKIVLAAINRDIAGETALLPELEKAIDDLDKAIKAEKKLKPSQELVDKQCVEVKG